MTFGSKHGNFHTWKCCLSNGGHVVSASLWWYFTSLKCAHGSRFIVFIAIFVKSISVLKIGQFAIPETCENWLGLVNNLIYFAYRTHEVYLVLPYSVDFKATVELWNPPSKTVLSKCSFNLNKGPMNIWNYRNDLYIGHVNIFPVNILQVYSDRWHRGIHTITRVDFPRDIFPVSVR